MAMSLTFAQFKQITGQTNTQETTEFDVHKVWAEYQLNNDTGKGSSGWSATDDEYELAQQAYAWLIAHMIKRASFESMPDEATLDEVTSPIGTGIRTTTFLEEYYRLINMINDTSVVEREQAIPTFRLVESD